MTVPPGIFSDNFIFVQDDTGGIKVYMASKRGEFPTIALADRLAVRGKVPLITGEREIQIEEVGTIQVRGKCNPIQPLQLATGAINEKVEGRLVELRGNVSTTDRGEFSIDDGSGAALVYIDTTTHIQLPSLARGQTARVIGIVSRAHNRPAVLPRLPSDLEFGARPTSTSTRTPTRTATRLPTSTATPTPTLALTPTQTPRVSMNHIDSPPTGISVANQSPAIPQWLNGQTVALVGATTSATFGLGFCALALLLWRRK